MPVRAPFAGDNRQDPALKRADEQDKTRIYKTDNVRGGRAWESPCTGDMGKSANVLINSRERCLGDPRPRVDQEATIVHQ